VRKNFEPEISEVTNVIEKFLSPISSLETIKQRGKGSQNQRINRDKNNLTPERQELQMMHQEAIDILNKT
jgi:hypothetical protein